MVLIGAVILTLVECGVMMFYTYHRNKTREAFERGYSEGYKDGQENRKCR